MSDQPIAAGHSSFDLIDPEAAFAAMGLSEGMVLYDVACGVGKYALAAAARLGKTGRVHAVDLWPEGIAVLKDQVAELGLKNVHPDCCDVSGRVPLADDSVDLCLMATVLHDLAHDGTAPGALQEVRRVLKPGARLAVIEFYKVEGKPGPPKAIRLDEAELESLVVPFGFRKERTVQVGPHNYLTTFIEGKN